MKIIIAITSLLLVAPMSATPISDKKIQAEATREISSIMETRDKQGADLIARYGEWEEATKSFKKDQDEFVRLIGVYDQDHQVIDAYISYLNEMDRSASYDTIKEINEELNTRKISLKMKWAELEVDMYTFQENGVELARLLNLYPNELDLVVKEYQSWVSRNKRTIKNNATRGFVY